MQYVNLDSIAREFEDGRTFCSANRAFCNLLDVVAWHEPLESESRFTSLDLAGVLSTLEDFSTYVELASIRANDLFDYQLDRHCSKTSSSSQAPVVSLITS